MTERTSGGQAIQTPQGHAEFITSYRSASHVAECTLSGKKVTEKLFIKLD